MSRNDVKIMEPETSFDKVKDVLESQFLKKLRISNIYKALKASTLQNKQVKLIFSSDQSAHNEVKSLVKGIDEQNVCLDNAIQIPIHAIKEVKF